MRFKKVLSAEEAAADSLPEENGDRYCVRLNLRSMWYVTVMRETREHLWTAP